MTVIDIARCQVYLAGDSEPIEALWPVERFLSHLAATELNHAEYNVNGFVRFPTSDGDALVRPSAIAAILPWTEEDE